MPRYTIYMAQSFLIFDFGADEPAAQQARHKIEGWKQAFRLGNKILLKFEREEAAEGDGSRAKAAAAEKESASKKKSAAKGKKDDAGAPAEPPSRIRLLIRLDFSDHEKLSHQRWLDRIPTEDPFKFTKAETVRHTDPEFSKTMELFDSLD
ncbi:MAG TPA: hypothetical protein VEG64_12200 [Candidatus Sulfotelmatobacter sp.]|nr:hypothetical protein [Candidatus Sulfotelmatobacter sp.]